MHSSEPRYRERRHTRSETLLTVHKKNPTCNLLSRWTLPEPRDVFAQEEVEITICVSHSLSSASLVDMQSERWCHCFRAESHLWVLTCCEGLRETPMGQEGASGRMSEQEIRPQEFILCLWKTGYTVWFKQLKCLFANFCVDYYWNYKQLLSHAKCQLHQAFLITFSGSFGQPN